MTEKEAINVLMSLSIDVGGMHYPELRKYEHAIEEIICLLLSKVPPTRSELEEAYDNGCRAAKADFHKPAQPEIVRCKDCKYSDTYPKDADNDMPLKCLGIRYGGVMPDWYCEHAERRTDETD